MKKFFPFFLCLFLLGFSPLEMNEVSNGYILIDTETEEVLESHNIDTPLSIASTTKLMSYLIFKEALDKGDWTFDTIITASRKDKRSGSSYGIEPEKEYSVKELMTASLVISGNDATVLLARHLAGSEEKFTQMMNERAKELELTTAKFYNCTGLPVYPQDVQNQMSIRDLSKLSLYLLKKHKEILNFTSIEEIPIPNTEEFEKNTNPLLGIVKGADGLKTGYTKAAGRCLVWTVKCSNSKTRLLGINMGFKKLEERDRFIIDFAEYSKKNYAKDVWVSKKMPIVLYVRESKEKFLICHPDRNFEARRKDSKNFKRSLRINENKYPFKEGEVVGKVFVKDKNRVIFETELRAE